MAERFGNQAEQTITLTAGVSAGDLTWPISALGSGAFVIPSDGDFSVRCENEIVKVTAVTGLNLTVERGAEGTTAASHLSGVRIYHLPTKRSMDALAQIYSEAFTAQTTVTIAGATHGFDFSVDPPIIQAYDDSSPTSMIAPSTVSYSALNGDVTVTFGVAQSGIIVLTGRP